MIKLSGRVYRKMSSSSWYLVLLTLFLAVYTTGVESKRSKHHRGNVSLDNVADVSKGSASDVQVYTNESRIRVPTQDPVSYEGDQVFRVFVDHTKGRKRVNDLVNKGGKNYFIFETYLFSAPLSI